MIALTLGSAWAYGSEPPAGAGLNSSDERRNAGAGMMSGQEKTDAAKNLNAAHYSGARRAVDTIPCWLTAACQRSANTELYPTSVGLMLMR